MASARITLSGPAAAARCCRLRPAPAAGWLRAPAARQAVRFTVLASSSGYQQPLSNQERKAKRAESQRLGRQVRRLRGAALALRCAAAGPTHVVRLASPVLAPLPLLPPGRPQLVTVNLGQKGLTPAFIDGFRKALAANELVKVGRGWATADCRSDSMRQHATAEAGRGRRA